MENRPVDMFSYKAFDLISDLLRTGKLPEDTPDSLLENESFRQIVGDLSALQDFAMAVSKGDLDQPLPLRGYMAGALKSLQASLCHLTWQTQQVAAGDFDQRVDFMGDFSEAFNHMVVALADQRERLAQREACLLQTNSEQQHEIAWHKKTGEDLAHQASHDSLTGLPNRYYFEQHLSELITSSSGKGSHSMAVLFLDLDKFKLINDTLGHKIGDLLLVEVAGRLQLCLRSEDLLARMGGDEFTVILPRGVRRATVESVASRMIDSISPRSRYRATDL